LSTVYALIGTAAFRKYSIGGRLVIDNDSLDDFKRLFGHSWTRDNFGPVIVPSGHYFVLGDNRHGAADSRFTGFIDQQDFRGTVLKIY
jgi:signal peptidase I